MMCKRCSGSGADPIQHMPGLTKVCERCNFTGLENKELSENEKWLIANGEEYKGKFVALNKGKFISWGVTKFYLSECAGPFKREEGYTVYKIYEGPGLIWKIEEVVEGVIL